MAANRRAEIPAEFETGWLDQLDGRRNLSKQMRARFDEMASDLGGASALSYAQRSLIERALWTEYWIASQERELSKGAEVDVGKLVQANNALLGLFKNLGLERRQRDVPDLTDYLRQRKEGHA